MSDLHTTDDPAFARRFFAGKEPIQLADVTPGQQFYGVEPEFGHITRYLAMGQPRAMPDDQRHIVTVMHMDSGVTMDLWDGFDTDEVFCITPEAR